MRRLDYAPQAEQDLIDIYAYSILQWGEARADRYLHDMRAALDLVAENPFTARLRHEVSPAVRVAAIGSHLAIYATSDTTVRILRVVHSRRNWRALDFGGGGASGSGVGG